MNEIARTINYIIAQPSVYDLKGVFINHMYKRFDIAHYTCIEDICEDYLHTRYTKCCMIRIRNVIYRCYYDRYHKDFNDKSFTVLTYKMCLGEYKIKTIHGSMFITKGSKEDPKSMTNLELNRVITWLSLSSNVSFY